MFYCEKDLNSQNIQMLLVELTFKSCSMQAQYEQNNTSTKIHVCCLPLLHILCVAAIFIPADKLIIPSFSWTTNISQYSGVSHVYIYYIMLLESSRMRCYDHLTKPSGIIHTCIVLVHLFYPHYPTINYSMLLYMYAYCRSCLT